jgi:hypothetical protein
VAVKINSAAPPLCINAATMGHCKTIFDNPVSNCNAAILINMFKPLIQSSTAMSVSLGEAIFFILEIKRNDGCEDQ